MGIIFKVGATARQRADEHCLFRASNFASWCGPLNLSRLVCETAPYGMWKVIGKSHLRSLDIERNWYIPGSISVLADTRIHPHGLRVSALPSWLPAIVAPHLAS